VQLFIEQALCLCMLVADATSLVGMGKKLRPIELCFYTLTWNCGDKLMWSIVQNNSRARWGPIVSRSLLFMFSSMMAAE